MATTSYLEEAAGGMVTAAAFDDDDAAVSAVTLLRESGVREQDISVIARDRHRAERVAGGRAWLPLKGWSGIMARLAPALNRCLPKDNRWHVHSTDQILLVTEGEGIIETNEERHDLVPGVVALVPANTRHWHGAKPGKNMTHWSILGPATTKVVD